MHLALALLLAGTSPQTGDCRADLAPLWPEVVEEIATPTTEGGKEASDWGHAKEAFANMSALCAKDREALNLLRSAAAQAAINLGAYKDAYAGLAQSKIDPSAPMAARDALNLITSAAAVGQHAYRRSIPQVRAIHTQAAAQNGLTATGSYAHDFGAIDAFRTDMDGGWRIYILWPSAHAPMLLSIPDTPSDRREASLVFCGADAAEATTSTAPKGMDDATALNYAVQTFKNARKIALPVQCKVLREILPGFSLPPVFTGDEFAPTDGGPSAKGLERLSTGSPAQREQYDALVVAHPERVPAEQLIAAALKMVQRGDRLRATFLFALWQIRYRPWQELGDPAGEGAVQSSVNFMFVNPLYRWIAADPDLMRDVLTRAASFEERMPPSPERPDGVEKAKWLETIVKSRAQWRAEVLDRLVPTSAKEREEMAEKRAQEGLSNGPITDGGAPLPDHWR